MKSLYLFAVAVCVSATAYSQNVGIGETNPASKATVKGNLSVGAGYSTTAAPTNGAIIEGPVGIGVSSPNTNAALDITSTNKGMLIPRVALVSTSSPISGTKPDGLMVYNTSTTGTYSIPGVYTWSSTANDWVRVITNTTLSSSLQNLTNQAGGGLATFTYNGSSAVQIGIASQGVQTGMIANDAVTTTQIAPNTITSADMGPNSVDLSSGVVTNLLPINRGGTNTNTIGSGGSIAYSNGTNYGFSPVGTSGQVLVSGGTGQPTWSNANAALTKNDITSGTTGVTVSNGTGQVVGGSNVTVSVATNSAASPGLVPAGSGNNNKVWGTDGAGNPTWTSVSNAQLANSGVTINTGTGLSGGGAVSLGGTLNLTNTGVTSLTGTANQVSVSQSTGAVTLTTPQNIHTGANVTFNSVTAPNDFFGRINVIDTRSTDAGPNTYDNEVAFEFKSRGALAGNPGTSNYGGLMTLAPWGDNSGDYHHQLYFNNAGIYYRTGAPDNTTWNGWAQLLTTGNISSNINGTVNYVPKFTGANSIGNSQIFDNATNVGIGTTSPAYKLDVQGGNARVNNTFIGDVGHGSTWAGFAHYSQASTSGYAMISSSDGNYTFINKQNTGTGYIGFRVANSDVAAITNAGWMGVNTTAPENTLHIVRSASGGNRAVAQFTSGGDNSWGHVLNLRTTGAGNDGAKILFRSRNAKNWEAGGDDAGSNDFVINEDGGDGVYGSGFGTTRFKIAAGGNVGIGTTGPTAKLHVYGGAVRVGTNSTDPGGTDGVLSIGNTAADYNPTTGNWTTSGSTMVLSANDYSTIGFHDAGSRVDFIRTGGGVMQLGYNGGWGAATVQAPSLAGTGNRAVYADASGNLRAGSGNDNTLWTMSANFSHSADDWCTGCSGTGSLPDATDDAVSTVSMPFSITINGTAYSQVSICGNGWVAFGATGANNWTNGTLPASFTTLPVIFPYWDDLQDYGSGEYVRWGYVGDAGARTFIIDYNQRIHGDGTSGNRVNFEVLIHEGSGLINVKYRDVMAPAYNGQSATIGFQLDGGSSAKAYPIVCNGKVLDDNRDDSEGWSVCPVR